MDARPTRRPTVPALAGVALLVALPLTLLLARMVGGGGTDAAPEAGVASAPVASAPAERTPPPGDGSAPFAVWSRDEHGDPVRWDPCAPVPFLLDLETAPEHAERDVRSALAVLADASGLDLVLLGETDERPSADRALVEQHGDGWRWRPVLIAWAAPGEGGLPLTVADRGVALPVAVRAEGREGLVTGQVVLNAHRSDLVPGFADRRDAIGATLLHELAHVLGLAHVADPSQLMSEDPGSGPVVLGAGDRAGLRAIGSGSGCSPAPTPASGRGLSAVSAR